MSYNDPSWSAYTQIAMHDNAMSVYSDQDDKKHLKDKKNLNPS